MSPERFSRAASPKRQPRSPPPMRGSWAAHLKGRPRPGRPLGRHQLGRRRRAAAAAGVPPSSAASWREPLATSGQWGRISRPARPVRSFCTGTARAGHASPRRVERDCGRPGKSAGLGGRRELSRQTPRARQRPSLPLLSLRAAAVTHQQPLRRSSAPLEDVDDQQNDQHDQKQGAKSDVHVHLPSGR